MRKLPLTTITAGVLTATALALACEVHAAPSGPSAIEQTVRQLQAQGFTVIVNKVGTEPMDQCTVASVRPGQTFSRADSGTPGAHDDIRTTVTGRTVYLDVSC